MNDNYKTNIEDKAQILSECWGITYEEAKKIIEEENMKFNLRKTIEENSKNILNAHMEALIKENQELKAQTRELAMALINHIELGIYDEEKHKKACEIVEEICTICGKKLKDTTLSACKGCLRSLDKKEVK